MSDPITINYKDQIVQCFGEWDWQSNCLVVGYEPDGTEIEDIFADGANDWYDAVQRIVDSPMYYGATIIELQAC